MTNGTAASGNRPFSTPWQVWMVRLMLVVRLTTASGEYPPARKPRPPSPSSTYRSRSHRPSPCACSWPSVVSWPLQQPPRRILLVWRESEALSGRGPPPWCSSRAASAAWPRSHSAQARSWAPCFAVSGVRAPCRNTVCTSTSSTAPSRRHAGAAGAPEPSHSGRPASGSTGSAPAAPSPSRPPAARRPQLAAAMAGVALGARPPASADGPPAPAACGGARLRCVWSDSGG